jgi:hypothetical protein
MRIKKIDERRRELYLEKDKWGLPRYSLNEIAELEGVNRNTVRYSLHKFPDYLKIRRRQEKKNEG